MRDPAVLDVARLVRDAGGRALLVGGCVRDGLLGGAPKDFDLEVYGLSPEKLKATLAPAFALDLVGASFGVLKLKGHDIDVALPRRETKLGLGHRAFEMETDPHLSLEEASARRDFTINAIYQDPLTDEILDPWNGRADLARHTLRHVSPRFVEDPLRVLRGMQFAARFGLRPAQETIDLCRTMTSEGLAPERLMGEWTKLLVQGVWISQGLAFLRSTGWVKYYPELRRLIGCPQDPEWHPEGDVWNHTLDCLDRFAAARDAAGPAAPGEDLVVGLAVLCHDFGKPFCTRYDPVKRHIRSLGHDEAGVGPTRAFLKRLTNEERLLRDVPPLVQMHMRPYAMWRAQSSDAAVRRLATKVSSIRALVRVAAADNTGDEACGWLLAAARRLAVADAKPKPLVQGRDLLARGFKPGPRVGAILKLAYEAQLDGRFATKEAGVAYAMGAMDVTGAAAPYVLWDWNGTLLDDTDAAIEALNVQLRQRNLPCIGRDWYRDHFAFPVRPFYARCGIDLAHEDWDALAREYYATYAALPKRLNAEARTALARVQAAGGGQSIISALRQDLLDAAVADCGIRGFFDFVSGVDSLDGESKLARARDLLARVVAKGERPGDVVLIGDSLHDKEVADALGIRCVLCAQGGHSAARLRAVAPTGETLLDALALAWTGFRAGDAAADGDGKGAAPCC